jgi:DNA primase
MAEKPVVLELAGREVTITNPGKVFFPKAGYTKFDIVNYFVAAPRVRSSVSATGRWCSSVS